MVAFDSNILIYILERNIDFFDKAVAIFKKIDQVGGVCSSLVITESVKGTVTSFDLMYPLHSSMINIVELDIKIANLAGYVRVKNSIKTPDAIHIATAVLAGASTFFTNDHKLLKLKVPGLTIRGL